MGEQGTSGAAPNGPSQAFLDSRAEPYPNCVILLHDPDDERRALVNRVVEEEGGAAKVIESFKSWRLPGGCGGGPVALLAASGACTVEQPVWDVMAACKSAGVKIIYYERGVRDWPVRTKCLPLVAGAAHLLDSDGSEFEAELRGLVQGLLRNAISERQEQDEIRQAMRQHGLVGESAVLRNVFRLCVRFSTLSDLPVLISGESGTGKELLARAIARMDAKRTNGPFVAVNCAAISTALLESEFFGHRRGAFTGADRERRGLIRAAEGGILFLDEIGELDVNVQAKLLRVLQENCVLGVGAEQEVPVNVRFVAATNRDLDHAVAEGRFRPDLLYRLRVLSISIPPLRERPMDLPDLVSFFLEKYRPNRERRAPRPSPDFLEALGQLSLPGNAREVGNLIQQALVNHWGEGPLDLADLPNDTLQQLSGKQSDKPAAQPGGPSSFDPHLIRPPVRERILEITKEILENEHWSLARTMQECERQVVQAAIVQTHGNQSQTARLLGISSRSVYTKVRKYRLDEWR